MRLKSYLMAGLVAASLGGCAGKITLGGWYGGTMPCADCEGIKSRLFIDPARVYTLETTYMGKSDVIYQTSGIWHVDQDTAVLELIDDQLKYYVIDDGTLELLDRNGNRIKSEHNYKITR